MGKAIALLLVLAAGAAGAWHFLAGPGGAGGAPALGAALEAEHTLGLVSLSNLDDLAGELDGLLGELPEAQRSALDPEIRGAEGWAQALGFDPTKAGEWARVGLDPKAGIGVAYDARLMEPGHGPMPIIMLKVTDRAALVASLAERGLELSFSERAGPSEKMTADDQAWWVGERNGWWATLPIRAGDGASVRPQFDSFLTGAGAALADDDHFRDALADAITGGRDYLVTYADTTRVLDAVVPSGEGAQIARFFTERFPAVAARLNLQQGLVRLLTRGDGLTALRQILMPASSSARFSRYFPGKGWFVMRLSANLQEITDGVTSLIPPQFAQARGAVSMAEGAMTMLLGVSKKEVARGFSGHFAFGARVPDPRRGAPGPQDLLMVAGLQRADDAVNVTRRLLEKITTPGGQLNERAGQGGPIFSAKAMGLDIELRFIGEVVVVGTAATVAEAVARSEHLSGAAADMLDGDAFYGVAVHADTVGEQLALGGLQIGDAILQKGAQGGFLLNEAHLDDRGVKISQGGLGFIGALAAISVPAFVRYVRKAKQSEAEINLKRIADGARYYYAEERVDRMGALMPKGLPPSVAPTPSRALCSDGDKYTPRVDDWAHPTWQALGFSLEAPHHYQYEFTSSGAGDQLTFTVRAIGDLDCDGVTSELSITGRVDEAGALGLSPIRRVGAGE